MALLHNHGTNRSAVLEAELLVGRSPRAGLRIEQPYVSTHHSEIRWAGAQWQLRDLGSRNGTVLNGHALSVGEVCALKEADVIQFGAVSESWTLTDASKPEPLAIPDDGGKPVVLSADVVGIPSDDEPQATVFRDIDGAWKLEGLDGQLSVIEQGVYYPVAGRHWRFSYPEPVNSTNVVADPTLTDSVELIFEVSLDEEHVHLKARFQAQTIDVGTRAHNYLLLTLARVRLQEQEQRLPKQACGWVYQDDIMRALNVDRSQLNLEVFRIRKHFERLALQCSFNVLERRPTTRQLRIGTSRVQIVSG